MLNLVRALSTHGDPRVETVLFIGPDRAQDASLMALTGLPRTRIVVNSVFAEDRVRKGAALTLATGKNRPIENVYRRESIDVAFAPAIYMGWNCDIPSIAWFPDFQHRRMPEMFSRAAWWKRELGYRAQVASSEMILLSSVDAEVDCLNYYPQARKRTAVGRFSVPVGEWPSADAAWQRLRSEGYPDDFVFLPNQFWQHKNHGVAIDAAAIMAERGSSRVILATGNTTDPRAPGYFAALQQRIQQRGAENNIRLLGQVEYSLVQAMLMSANAVLNPSRFEGWSTTIEEAKAVGTPLLLSNLGVHREQAPDAKFFSPDNAAALADLIETALPRNISEVRQAVSDCNDYNIQRARQFGEMVSQLVVKSYENRKRT